MMDASAPSQIVSTLLARGFSVLDQVEELGNGRPQAGLPISGVTYLGRTKELLSEWQYVSVIASPFNPDEHLETTIEVFHVRPPKKVAPGGLDSHTRMERGFSPTYAMIRRDLPSILADLDAPHPLPPKPQKRS